MRADGTGHGVTVQRRRIAARRWLWWSVGLGVAAGGLAFPFDGAVAAWARSLAADGLGGDLELELRTLQQFGDLATTALIAVTICLLDPGMRRRLLDWLAGILVAGVGVTGLKMLVGRPRPRLEDPSTLLGPFGAYPLGPEVGVRHGWEVWADISSDLWSMPSSHTAFAGVAAGFLMTAYPRLRPLALAMVGVVGVCRVLFGAHYPADVLVGAGIGVGIGVWCARRHIGVRALDGLWRVAVDRGRVAALPGVVRLRRLGR